MVLKNRLILDLEVSFRELSPTAVASPASMIMIGAFTVSRSGSRKLLIFVLVLRKLSAFNESTMPIAVSGGIT